jgi:hypothetical protein
MQLDYARFTAVTIPLTIYNRSEGQIEANFFFFLHNTKSHRYKSISDTWTADKQKTYTCSTTITSVIRGSNVSLTER